MTELSTSDIDRSVEEIMTFHTSFHSFFRVKTRDVIKQSLQYQQGLLLGDNRKNMTNMEKTVPDCDHQSLQNFISDSKWDEEGVICEIQRRVGELIGNPVHGSVHLDESGFLKDGNSSVGVKRQYCGRFGKVDNCQVGVFLGYAFWSYRTLIDKRLYLPEDWANDHDRREMCRVPEEITFKTKAEWGWEMLLNARKGNLPFAWVGMDSFYGQQPWFLDKLDGENFLYIADIPNDTRVWLERPKVEVPKRKGDRGRHPTRKQLVEGEPKPTKVRKIAEELPDDAWDHIFLRDTEKKSYGAIWRVYVYIRLEMGFRVQNRGSLSEKTITGCRDKCIISSW